MDERGRFNRNKPDRKTLDLIWFVQQSCRKSNRKPPEPADWTNKQCGSHKHLDLEWFLGRFWCTKTVDKTNSNPKMGNLMSHDFSNKTLGVEIQVIWFQHISRKKYEKMILPMGNWDLTRDLTRWEAESLIHQWFADAGRYRWSPCKKKRQGSERKSPSYLVQPYSNEFRWVSRQNLGSKKHGQILKNREHQSLIEWWNI